MELNKIITSTISEYLIENRIQGEKYIVFHSSNQKFNKFDESKITNLGGDLYGEGFYFTDNLNYSRKFGHYTYKCEIILNQPLNLTNSSTKEQLKYLLNRINLNKDDYRTIFELINSNSYTTAFRYMRKHISFNELKYIYDGAIGYADTHDGGKEYVVYNPDKIRIIEMIDNRVN